MKRSGNDSRKILDKPFANGKGSYEFHVKKLQKKRITLKKSYSDRIILLLSRGLDKHRRFAVSARKNITMKKVN